MDLKDTVLQALNELVKNGGEGSGDFNHAGNPPHVGGSEPVGSRHARGFKSKSERKEVNKEKNEETPLIPKVNPIEPSKPTYNPPPIKEPDREPHKKQDGDEFTKILEPLIKPKQLKELKEVKDYIQKQVDVDITKHVEPEYTKKWGKGKQLILDYKRMSRDEQRKIDSLYKGLDMEMHGAWAIGIKKKANNSIYKHEYIDY